jgi:hypothetical protein
MSEHDDRPWKRIGAHAVRLEPPVTMFVRANGPVLVEDARALIAEMHRFAEGKGRIFVLGDTSGVGALPADARKVMAELLLDVPIGATAVFGASFAQRVIVTLADKTNNLIRGSRRYETRFFSTEQEARAWLERQAGAR